MLYHTCTVWLFPVCYCVPCLTWNSGQSCYEVSVDSETDKKHSKNTHWMKNLQLIHSIRVKLKSIRQEFWNICSIQKKHLFIDSLMSTATCHSRIFNSLFCAFNRICFSEFCLFVRGPFHYVFDRPPGIYSYWM